MFTARYGLSPYIKQRRLAFKGLENKEELSVIFRKRIKNVVTSKGIRVRTECK